MIIGLTNEQRERLDAATKTYHEELATITKEVVKDCKTQEDMKLALAVIRVAVEQAAEKVEDESLGHND